MNGSRVGVINASRNRCAKALWLPIPPDPAPLGADRKHHLRSLVVSATHLRLSDERASVVADFGGKMSQIHIPDDPTINSHGQDVGYCPECKEHLDSGRCECPEYPCDNCGRGMGSPTTNTGFCAICDLEWDANHQLTFGENLPVPVLAEPQTNRRLTKLRGSGEARESNMADKPTVQHRNQSRAGQCPPTRRGGQNTLSSGMKTDENSCNPSVSEVELPRGISSPPAQNLSDTESKAGTINARVITRDSESESRLTSYPSLSQGAGMKDLETQVNRCASPSILDKLGPEAAGLVWALRQLDRYLT